MIACIAQPGSSSRLGNGRCSVENSVSSSPLGVKMSTQTTDEATMGVKVGRKKITRNQRWPRLTVAIHSASPSEITMFRTRYSTVYNSVLRRSAKNVRSLVNSRT